ncbi:protein RFT1 homolog isoform X1 [Culicoides brevitarsis]|uniref:protein RFT1 homolog isoform X1 n=1 Tax=Culicoides brevitarsis TaxID=469753 RepID=UPI00307B6C34
MGRNVLESSIKKASFSCLSKIFCRFISFTINAFIVRFVGRDVLGIMNVRLLLIESTLLFLSKEAISRAALSTTTQHKNKSTWPQLINQMWITVPICALVSFPVVYAWLNWLSPVGDLHYEQYVFSAMLMAISCVFELTAEAPIFVGQVFCFVKLKVVLDTLHIVTRSIIFVCIILYDKNMAIMAFGLAQFTSAATIVIGNYAFFHYYIRKLKEYREMVKKNDNDKTLALEKFGPYYDHMEDFPFTGVTQMIPCVWTDDEPRFNKDLQVLVLSFVKQGVLKQILTEGEKYVMTISPVLSFAQQATYDVVNNMGSLAARFIFRPIEDSCYFYYTQTIARDVALKDQPRNKVLEAATVLSQVCRAVTSIGLLGLVFGQSYAGTLLLLYGGADFVSGGLPETLLRWHCVAIVLLAVNGVTEGYIFATKTSKEIDAYNYYMAIFSVTFLLLSYQLTNMFGPVGFILANICNMVFRISYSTNYITKQFNTVQMKPLQGLLPGKMFAAVLLVVGLTCKFSESNILPHSIIYHLLVGVLCGAVAMVSWCYENRALVQIGIDRVKSGKPAEKVQ